jgi:predicted glycosyltransferase
VSRTRQIAERKRVLYYSHDGFGLGHIRSTLAMVNELSRRRPDVAHLAMTGSLETHAWELPATFDYVKLPATAKSTIYQGLPAWREPRAVRPRAGIWAVREAIIHRTASSYLPHALYVDWSPAGHQGELRRGLMALHELRPRPTLVLALTDLISDGETIRGDWRRDRAYPLLDDVYDHILVYGSPEIFDVVSEYHLSPAAAAKLTYCGYHRRIETLTPPEQVRTRLGATNAPLVVVTTGGGADGSTIVANWLRAARSPELDGVVSFVVAGPLMPARDQERLRDVAAPLSNVHFVPFTNEFISHINAADVVITMCGYNTVSEVLSLGKRSIVIPRSKLWKEQVIRAERLEELGYATYLRPDELSPDRLRDAVLASLAEPPPHIPLSFDGLARGAEIVARGL